MAGVKSWEEIAKEPNSGVKKVHRKLHLSFPPYYLADLKKSVASVLDARLNSYEENLGGLLAGYGKVSILKSVGETLFNLSEIHIDIEGDFFVFSPIVGIELIGTVNKKGYGHIGAIVHGLFNVSLPQPYKVSNQDWLGKTAKLQDQVKFVITRVDLLSQVPFIEGNIVELKSQGEDMSSRERCHSDSGVSIASDESSVEELENKKRKQLHLANQSASEPSTPLIQGGKKHKRIDSASSPGIPNSKKKKSDDVVELVSNLFTAIDESKKTTASSSKQKQKICEKSEDAAQVAIQDSKVTEPIKKKSKKKDADEDPEDIIQKLLQSNLPAYAKSKLKPSKKLKSSKKSS